MVSEGFEEIRPLGRGAFGEVVLAKRKSDGSFCAIKHIRKSEVGATEAKEHATEVRALKTLKHPFILRIFGASEDEHTVSIVTEFADAGDLQQLLKRFQEAGHRLDGMELLAIFAQLTSAVSHVHSAHIMHRDLKPSNVLLTTSGCLKLGDFGVAKVLAGTTCCDQLTCVGTPTYMAPEIVGGEPYGPPCDIWSLGVMLYEMYTFRKPFEGRSLGELAMRVASGYYKPVSDVVAQPRDVVFADRLSELVDQMLRTNFRVRAKIGDVARHELLRYLVSSLRSCVAVLTAVLRRSSGGQSEDESSLVAELDQASAVIPMAAAPRPNIGRSTSGGSTTSAGGSTTVEGTVVRNRPPRTPGVKGSATPPETEGTQRLLSSRSFGGDSLAFSDTTFSLSLTGTVNPLGVRSGSRSLLELSSSGGRELEKGVLSEALAEGSGRSPVAALSPPSGGEHVPFDTMGPHGPLLAASMDSANLAALLGREVDGCDGADGGGGTLGRSTSSTSSCGNSSMGRGTRLPSILSASSPHRGAGQAGESVLDKSLPKMEDSGMRQRSVTATPDPGCSVDGLEGGDATPELSAWQQFSATSPVSGHLSESAEGPEMLAQSQRQARKDRQQTRNLRRREPAASEHSDHSDPIKTESPESGLEACSAQEQRQKQLQRERQKRQHVHGSRPSPQAEQPGSSSSSSAPPALFRRGAVTSPRASQSESPDVFDSRPWRKPAAAAAGTVPASSPGGAGSANSTAGPGRFRSGMSVFIHGLKMSPELNGSEGVLRHFERERCRWIVRLSDTGDERALKPENLIDAAAGTKSPSPPTSSKSPRLPTPVVAGMGTGGLPGNVRVGKGSPPTPHRRSVAAMHAGLQPPPSHSLGRLLPHRSTGGATGSRPASRGRLRVA